MPEDEEYQLSISLNILTHLGINLYSNVPAVISEAVANSWDADASTVSIVLNKEQGTITITDDGCGMSRREINRKYLRVGYPKRDSEPKVTPKNRHVLGRKGIGKLALFSIAKTVEVHSVKCNESGAILEKNGFVMDADAIKRYIEEEEKAEKEEKAKKGAQAASAEDEDGSLERKRAYKPVPVDAGQIEITKGTRITLRNLKKELTNVESNLRKRLARRFSIIGAAHGFNVLVNDAPIGLADRDFYSKLQYVWFLGEESKAEYAEDCKNVEESVVIADNLVDGNPEYKVTGWVGTFREHGDVDEDNNAITLLAWGKVIQDDILKDLKKGGVFSKYLIGEIRADFLDSDELDDIATSDRQAVKEDDPRYPAIKNYVLKEVVNKIHSSWEGLRKKYAEKSALTQPKVKEWYESLGPDNKKYAVKLFEKIESIKAADVQVKRELYKQGIVAFQSLAIKDNLSALDEVKTEEQFETMCRILSSLDYLEAIHYYNIVAARLEVLDKFVELVPKEREAIIRDYLFEHLWLLDPSWERATTDAHIEETVTKAFDKISAGLSEAERKGRIDIRYKSAAGEHIIVELKRADIVIKATDLAGQVQKYKGALEKCLRQSLGYLPPIKIVCILGSEPAPQDRRAENEGVLAQVGARAITYDFLIADARKKYSSFLKKRAEIRRLNILLDELVAEDA